MLNDLSSEVVEPLLLGLEMLILIFHGNLMITLRGPFAW